MELNCSFTGIFAVSYKSRFSETCNSEIFRFLFYRLFDEIFNCLDGSCEIDDLYFIRIDLLISARYHSISVRLRFFISLFHRLFDVIFNYLGGSCEEDDLDFI